MSIMHKGTAKKSVNFERINFDGFGFGSTLSFYSTGPVECKPGKMFDAGSDVKLFMGLTYSCISIA